MGFVTAAAGAQPEVDCETLRLLGGDITSLSGRYMYIVDVDATGEFDLASHMLVLDRAGEIIQEIPIQQGEIVQIAIRDNVLIQEHEHGPFHWKVHAPGVLFRAEIQQGFLSDRAYCSPFAAIRVDRPEDRTFVQTTASGDDGVSAHLIAGMAQMRPESIGIEVDCVDIVAATGAVFPGGPFNGSAEIAGTMVGIDDLVGDFDKGTLSFTLSGLPGGTHLVKVSGVPTYVDELPPGHVHWNRPLGALMNEAEIYVFAVEITSPTEGQTLPLGTTTVAGTISHGLAIDSLRVYGADVPLPPAVLIPGDGCVGDVLQVQFSVDLPAADVGQDFDTGDGVLSALDPGVNFITALAADKPGHVANDRVRIALGDVVEPALAGPVTMDGLGPSDCDPVAEIAGYATNGFGVSLSEDALNIAVRAEVLDMIRTELADGLNMLVGTSVVSLIDPCAAAAPADPSRMVWYRGQWYPVGVLEQFLNERTGRQPAQRRARRPGPPGPNAPPEWTPIRDASVNPLALLQIQLMAEDPDGDDVMFLPGSIPANSQIAEDRFEFLPDCNQIGDHVVTLIASDGMAETEETFTVTVNDLDPGLPVDPVITNVIFNADDMDMSVSLAAADAIEITFDSGPIEIVLHDDECVIDCWLACCFSYNLDFEVLIDNIRVTTTLTPQQLLCGTDNLPEPDVELQGLEVHFSDVSVGGVLAWITPAGLLVQILDLFGLPEFLLNEFASDLIEDEIRGPLADAIVDQFPGDFAGLGALEFSTDLPPGIPLTLDAQSSNILQVIPNEAIVLGLHSRFTPQAPVDPTPPWFPTTSILPDAGMQGADVVAAISDDTLNQMFSAMVATGILRHEFAGLTVGDVAPGLVIPELGIEADTPILLTVDASQDDDGNAIPPIFGFTDDPLTDGLEFKVRVQVTGRGILPRGGTVTDDRDLCSCLDFTPGCMGEPCLIYETVLKLNFLATASLIVDPGPVATLVIDVTQVQKLVRDGGFDSYEAMNFADDEDQIVETSATSPVLEMLRVAVDGAIPPFVIPMEALTLEGLVNPTNLRLFSATLDDAGLGFQDYAGILADVEP